MIPRSSPHRGIVAHRLEFAVKVMNAQGPSEILSWLAEQPTLARTISAAKRLDAAANAGDPLVRFAILRNFTIEPGLTSAVTVESARLGLRASTYLGEYDNVPADVYEANSPLYATNPDIIVLALRLHVLAPRLVNEFAALAERDVEALCEGVLARLRSFVEAIRSHSRALVLVHNFERPLRPAFGLIDRGMRRGQTSAIDRLNDDLAGMLESCGAYVVDVDSELARIGYERALDDRFWHLARSPYTLAVHARLAGLYARAAAALKGKTKKCLVLDCDNTLWGGVIGEDGMSGIALGAAAPGSAFVEFHQAILDLYHRGVLLALNSKNNERDALDVFEHHPQSLLRRHHFVATRINWNDKASNLTEIAAELNIGVDSLVFVDDNPVECRLVRERLPSVTTIELPKDPSRFARLLRELPSFDTLTLSDEDRRRSEMYRAEAERTKLHASSGSMDAFLASLDMVLTIEPATPFSIPRIAQLTQKTNQFNLTTRRQTEAEIAAAAADPARRVLSAELTDLFDRSGIIAVVMTRDTGTDARIETFLMSCRVIGRGVEEALVAAVAAAARARGMRRLLGEYVPTAKNALVADFYERMGFDEIAGSDREAWQLDLGAALPSMPAWFKEVRDGAAPVGLVR